MIVQAGFVQTNEPHRGHGVDETGASDRESHVVAGNEKIDIVEWQTRCNYRLRHKYSLNPFLCWGLLWRISNPKLKKPKKIFRTSTISKTKQITNKKAKLKTEVWSFEMA